jgi:metal-responsive CopG/Arc/MetJ family transcriptional regulator
MARRTKIIGFSVHPKLAEEFAAICEEENRSKSEMFREMFQEFKYRRRLEREQALL